MVKICKQPSLDSISIKALLLCGGVLRLLLIIYAAFHDQWFRVRYTDIDYMIVVDGARNMWTGGSPFDRTTYRYTPLLAALVLPSVWFAHPMGKIIFALCDLGAAYYCYSALITFATERSARRVVMLFILFNPIVLSVSTRGNSDMLVTFKNLMVLCKFTRGNVYQAAAVLVLLFILNYTPLIIYYPWYSVYGSNR
uniref:GPI mannosyltransferase I n=1 Tax=Trypanosoma congolense (strain IL3000) TaxID=1068625 RepID=G0UNS7_TRYCI|nr:unnamed protein product [Trypanosoma congolense IL3000]